MDEETQQNMYNLLESWHKQLYRHRNVNLEEYCEIAYSMLYLSKSLGTMYDNEEIEKIITAVQGFRKTRTWYPKGQARGNKDVQTHTNIVMATLFTQEFIYVRNIIRLKRLTGGPLTANGEKRYKAN